MLETTTGAKKGPTRYIRRKIGLFAFLLPFFLVVVPGMAVGHPHAWIDLRSTVILDDAGQAIAIEQEWLFDPFYTVFVMEEAGRDATAQKQALTDLARTNLKNLRDYDYFTEVRANGVKATLGTVREFESELRGDRLWMRFVVPLVDPIDPKASRLSFAVFDPTYYAEILHLEGDIIVFQGPTGSGCFGRIVPPNPNPEAVLLAQALDRGAAPDDTLGRIFAEWVEVTCK